MYYHTDHLGSAVRLTDNTGNIVQSIAYDPFGKTVFASGIENTKYQFTDQEFDDGTGFYYYGARYYDPEMGRFLQADTILAGLNRYAYCWNNPVIFTDPSGHNPHYTTGDYIVSDSYEKDGQTYIDVTYISPDHLTTYQFEGDTVTYDSNGIITGSTYLGNTSPMQGSGQNGSGGVSGDNKNPDPINKTEPDGGDPFVSWNKAVTQFNNDFYAAWDACTNLDFGADFIRYADESWENGDYFDAILFNADVILEYTLDSLAVLGGAYLAGYLVYEVGPAVMQKIIDAGGTGVKVGQDLGKLGKVVETTGGKITGFTSHGLNQAITRMVKASDILNTVRNPLIQIQQTSGNMLFISNEAAVVLNKAGGAVTIYGAANFDATILGLLRK